MSTIKVDTYLTRGGASEIAIDKLKGASSASSISVVGEGGTTTTNLQQGLVKSWISANFSSQAYNDSFNQSSLSDEGVGSFRFTLTNNFANVNYALGTEASHVTANGTNTQVQDQLFSRTTAAYQAYVSNDGSSVTGADTTYYTALLAGDLA